MTVHPGRDVPIAAAPPHQISTLDPAARPDRMPAVQATDPGPDAVQGGGPSAARTADGRALLRVTHAEVIKLLSLRSSLVALGVAAFLIVFLGSVTTAGAAFAPQPRTDDGDAPALAALDAPMGGVGAAFFAIAAVGVLAVSGEYSTRTILATLAAVPRRGQLVAGKAVAVAAVTFLVALPSTVVSYLIGRGLLTAGGVPAAVPAGDAVRVVVGAALYLVVVALAGSGFAWLLRSTAGALAALIGLLAIVPALVPALFPSIADQVAPFLPNAGAAVFQSVPMTAPWAGLAVFAAYGIGLLVLATDRIRRRDS